MKPKPTPTLSQRCSQSQWCNLLARLRCMASMRTNINQRKGIHAASKTGRWGFRPVLGGCEQGSGEHHHLPHQYKPCLLRAFWQAQRGDHRRAENIGNRQIHRQERGRERCRQDGGIFQRIYQTNKGIAMEESIKIIQHTEEVHSGIRHGRILNEDVQLGNASNLSWTDRKAKVSRRKV